MTDIEKLTCAFDAIGCKYKIITAKEYRGVDTYTDQYNGSVTWDTIIVLNNGIGYYQLECYHYFLKGKYKGHGCWE